MIKWCPIMGNVIHITEEQIAELDELSYEDILNEIFEGCPR